MASGERIVLKWKYRERSPSYDPEGNINDGNFSRANFGWHLILVIAAAQRCYVHLFGLVSHLIFVFENCLDDEKVTSSNNDNWEKIKEPAGSQHVGFIVERRSQVIEGTARNYQTKRYTSIDQTFLCWLTYVPNMGSIANSPQPRGDPKVPNRGISAQIKHQIHDKQIMTTLLWKVSGVPDKPLTITLYRSNAIVISVLIWE